MLHKNVKYTTDDLEIYICLDHSIIDFQESLTWNMPMFIKIDIKTNSYPFTNK